MEDQTTVTTKPEPLPTAAATRENGNSAPSHVFQISIRGWIATVVTLTFCAGYLLGIEATDLMKFTVTAVISLYFGQNQKKT